MKSSLSFLLFKGIPNVGGICVSAICIVHCLVLPFVLTSYFLQSWVPVKQLSFIHNEKAHEIMLIFTIAFGITSLYFSARRGKHMAVLCLCLGLVAVLLAELLLHGMDALRVPGTLCIVGGHLWAMRRSRTTCPC